MASSYDERAEWEYNEIIETATWLDHEYIQTGEVIRNAQQYTPDDFMEDRDLYENLMRGLTIPNDDPPPLPIEGRDEGRDEGNGAGGESYSGDDRGVVNEVFGDNTVNVVFHSLFEGPDHDPPKCASELFGYAC